MFITKRNALTIKLVLRTTRKTEEALIDSGATKNFLNPQAVTKLRLITEDLDKPQSIHNIDGTNNQAGLITKKCRLKIRLGKVDQEMDFFITNLGQDRIVLGYPFLRVSNPTINWEKGNIHHTSLIEITPVLLLKHCRRVWQTDKDLCFLRKATFAQKWTAAANQSKEKLKETDIPISYQKHWRVFSEEGAKRLPPHRKEDMMIKLKNDAPAQLDCKVYPLTKRETEVLHQSLKEDLAKGYIRHGTSSYISPVFFIGKKDGDDELQMVIDYQISNEHTQKDFYPLPNLCTELEKLSKHCLFSKFDVRAGYNNIRITEKDQYKAAFKTPLGTFIPTVMTFGFCNAPSIFQRAMNHDLAPLKQKYPDNFANYMDDVAIGTNDSSKGRELH